MKETIWTKIKRKKYEAKQWIRKKAMKAKARIQVKVSMRKRSIKRWAKEKFCRKAMMIERLEADLAGKEAQLKAMEKRFMRLGDQIETMEQKGPALQTIIQQIDIEPIQFGKYLSMTMLDPNIEYQDEIFKEAKGRITEQIANALIENNLVQFIIGDQNKYSTLDMFTTVAAKITVVPWEQMAIGRRIRMTVRR